MASEPGVRCHLHDSGHTTAACCHGAVELQKDASQRTLVRLAPKQEAGIAGLFAGPVSGLGHEEGSETLQAHVGAAPSQVREGVLAQPTGEQLL